MKKDIEIRKVEDVAIAVIPKDEEFWDVFLINLLRQLEKNTYKMTKQYTMVKLLHRI
mgnify:CR=1 FL=1